MIRGSWNASKTIGSSKTGVFHFKIPNVTEKSDAEIEAILEDAPVFKLARDFNAVNFGIRKTRQDPRTWCVERSIWITWQGREVHS